MPRSFGKCTSGSALTVWRSSAKMPNYGQRAFNVVWPLPRGHRSHFRSCPQGNQCPQKENERLFRLLYTTECFHFNIEIKFLMNMSGFFLSGVPSRNVASAIWLIHRENFPIDQSASYTNISGNLPKILGQGMWNRYIKKRRLRLGERELRLMRYSSIDDRKKEREGKS